MFFALKSVVNFSMGRCEFSTISNRYAKKRICFVLNNENENVSGIISKFAGMKKYAAPVILFVLACALIVYLKVDFSGSSTSFDVGRYMKTRAKVDSLEMALWNAQGNVDAQVTIRDELSNAWEELATMRTSSAPADAENPEENVGGFSGGVWLWIIGGTLAVLLCSVVLVLVLIHRKKVVETRMMEALAKARETGEMSAVNRAVANNETMTSTRVHAPKKSIIDEAEEFAAKRRETQAMQASAASAAEPKAAFEDENGVPENKILTSPFYGKTIVRPTARERITSAMQSLSDVLHHDRTKVSHAKEQTPPRPEVAAPAPAASPLEMNRFDRESSVNSKILQMSRRGFPASAIASKLRIPQAKVEAVIKEAVEAGN